MDSICRKNPERGFPLTLPPSLRGEGKSEGEVNPSTPRPEALGLLRVDPERRFFTPP